MALGRAERGSIAAGRWSRLGAADGDAAGAVPERRPRRLRAIPARRGTSAPRRSPQDQIEVGRLESARFGPFVSPVPDRGRRAAARRRPRPRRARIGPSTAARPAHRRRRRSWWDRGARRHPRRWPIAGIAVVHRRLPRRRSRPVGALAAPVRRRPRPAPVPRRPAPTPADRRHARDRRLRTDRRRADRGRTAAHHRRGRPAQPDAGTHAPDAPQPTPTPGRRRRPGSPAVHRQAGRHHQVHRQQVRPASHGPAGRQRHRQGRGGGSSPPGRGPAPRTDRGDARIGSPSHTDRSALAGPAPAGHEATR